MSHPQGGGGPADADLAGQHQRLFGHHPIAIQPLAGLLWRSPSEWCQQPTPLPGIGQRLGGDAERPGRRVRSDLARQPAADHRLGPAVQTRGADKDRAAAQPGPLSRG